MVEVRNRLGFADLKAAGRSYQDSLALADTPEVRAELRSLLSSWLVDDHGTLRPPIKTTPMAVISWPGGAAGEG